MTLCPGKGEAAPVSLLKTELYPTQLAEKNTKCQVGANYGQTQVVAGTTLMWMNGTA